MKKHSMIWSRLLLIGIFLTHITIFGYNYRPPRLTVVLVVDQFAHHYMNKLMPRLKHGLRYLTENGVVYTNAHMPHGQPGTATGHAGLNTGTCAKDHGFVSNSWYENGKKVACDDDFSVNARVIAPKGTYDFGKSAQRLKVDGLSDQCVLQSEPRSPFVSYSISGKSRSAIATARSWENRCGLIVRQDYLPQVKHILMSYLHGYKHLMKIMILTAWVLLRGDACILKALMHTIFLILITMIMLV